MSITVNVVVEFVSLKEHVIKYEFLSLKNRYASIKLAHAQACIKEKKRKKRHGFGSLQTQSLYFGKKRKCVSDEQSIRACTVIHMEFSLPLVLV